MMLSSLVTNVFNRISAYRNYRKTFKALSSLGDRELSDLGIYRGGIEQIARGAVR